MPKFCIVNIVNIYLAFTFTDALIMGNNLLSGEEVIYDTLYSQGPWLVLCL